MVKLKNFLTQKIDLPAWAILLFDLVLILTAIVFIVRI